MRPARGGPEGVWAMRKRVLIGGLVGGLVLFAWSAFTHLVVPIGEIGVDSLPSEASIVPALQAALSEPGFYLFPGDVEVHAAPEAERAAAMEAWTERYRRGPRGAVLYRPGGAELFSPVQMGTELLSSVAAALVLAFLLAQAAPRLPAFGHRVLFCALCGGFAWLSIHVPYWNWYGFPTDYTLGVFIDSVGGWTVAGLVIAAFVKPAD